MGDNIRDIAEKPMYGASDLSLGVRVRRGGIWLFSGRLVHRALTLLRTIILARLLSPDDFGLFGIALLTLSVLDTFSWPGFTQALIQKKGDTEPYLDTAWTIGVIRGAIIAAILFCAAPLVASFFSAPAADPIVKVIGLAILAQSLSNIAVIYFEKELEFHKYIAYWLSGTIVDLIVSVSAAFIFRSVWALVLGCLAGNVVRCASSYVIDPYRPRFRLDPGKAKELFGFGKWVMGSSVVIFLLVQGDDIIVGKLLGVAALGLYQIAYRISNLPATEITHAISQVTFPAYSKLQDNIRALREAYFKVLQLTVFLSFPIGVLIFIMAPDFTRIFLGTQWMPMVPAMQVLCIFGVTRSITATMGPILYSVGKPRLQAKVSTLQLIAMLILIYPLSVRWGILGTSIAVVIPNILVLFLMVRETGRILHAPYRSFLEKVSSSAAAIPAVICVVLLRRFLFQSTQNIYDFCLTAVLYGSVYIASAWVFDRIQGYQIRRQITEMLRSVAGGYGDRG